MAEVERMPTLTEINADLQDLDFDLGWLESMENLSACAEDGLPAGLLAHSDLPHGPLREPGSSPLGAGPSAHMHLVPPPPVTPPQHGEGQEHAEPAAQLHSMPATAAQQPGTVPTFQQLQALSMVDRQRLLSARGALYLHTKLLQQVPPSITQQPAAAAALPASSSSSSSSSSGAAQAPTSRKRNQEAAPACAAKLPRVDSASQSQLTPAVAVPADVLHLVGVLNWWDTHTQEQQQGCQQQQQQQQQQGCQQQQQRRRQQCSTLVAPLSQYLAAPATPLHSS